MADTQPAQRADQPQLKVSESDSDVYKDKAAQTMAIALLDNPAWRVWKPATDETRPKVYYDFIRPYFSTSPEGCIVAEVNDFSVCAVWQPPGPVRQYQPPTEGTDPEEYKADLEAYQVFEKYIKNHFGNNYYRLIVLARDTRQAKVAGDLRAVLELMLGRATAEKAPVYLQTTNPHARDIYLRFGFREVLAQHTHGNDAWALVWYPNTVTPIEG